MHNLCKNDVINDMCVCVCVELLIDKSGLSYIYYNVINAH